MKDKRTRHLILLSLIVSIFLYTSTLNSENFKFKNKSFGESGNAVITFLLDDCTPLIDKPERKSPIHRNSLTLFGFIAFNSFIYIVAILICLLLLNFIRDLRKSIKELIPAHFYGSKYDMRAIFS